MSDSKEIFLKDKELAKWWVGVTRDSRFTAVLTYGRAEIMEARPTQEQMVGAELLIHTLTNLPETDAAEFDFPNPGLHHQAEVSKPRPNKERK